jgi:hypothetical protein
VFNTQVVGSRLQSLGAWIVSAASPMAVVARLAVQEMKCLPEIFGEFARGEIKQRQNGSPV